MKINWDINEFTARKKLGGHGSVLKLCRYSGISTTYYYESKKRDRLSSNKLFSITNALDIHPGQLLLDDRKNGKKGHTIEYTKKYQETKKQHHLDNDLILNIKQDLKNFRNNLIT